ncbi:MAG: hypothetical protein ACKOVA_09010 [Novosphingobium sp.]
MTAMITTPFPAAAKLMPQFITVSGTAGRYYAVIPETMRKGAVPLVVVHGISRNAAELALRFGEIALLSGTPIIAPLFERKAFGMYQQVRTPSVCTQSDDALFGILDDASRRFGCDTAQIDLFGFSGGAQFAHRFAMLHPARARHCIAAAAGWYTMPDFNVAWPLGLRAAPRQIDEEALARVRFDVIVGGLDRSQDRALRRSPAIDAAQGIHRLQRARQWHHAMRNYGFRGGLTVIPGLSHAFSDAVHLGIVPLVFHLLGTLGADIEESAT